jgi:hypothetical protein
MYINIKEEASMGVCVPPCALTWTFRIQAGLA